MTTKQNGPLPVHYHNSIKSTSNSAVYQPVSSIITTPLTDKYTVGENIGRGKFAVVKKCTNKQTGEVVAAKFIKKRRRGKTCREEILREVVMLEMALNHPRLVNFKEVYETQQELILITEYCAGGELFTECILEEKFNEADVRLLMSQILEGLVYLHEKNIVHLDLKPQNILLTDEFPQGSVKICDLGFACLVNTGEDIRDIIGTPDYVAPEVLNYDPLGLYTDMWSLGVLTYVMLTTCSPFAADDKQQTFSNITSVNLDFPEDLFGSISVVAQDFIKKLLILEPRGRMTARQCFQHPWLSGLQNLSQPLICINMDNFSSENQKIDPYAENNKSVVKSDSREKIQNQTSEMSIIESPDENIISEEFSDIRGAGGDCLSSVSHMDDFSLEEVCNENEGFDIDCVVESGRHLINICTGISPDDDKETKDSQKPMVTYLDVGLNESIEHLETVAKNLCVQNHIQDMNVNAVDILPNTDKLPEETYSEMIFGNDISNPETVYFHEASLNSSRVEPKLSVNQDHEELNLNEQVEDSEMFIKNFIEEGVETKSLIFGDELDQRGHADIEKHLSEILVENDKISKGINRAENEADIEMEESDVKHNQNMTRDNENNSSDSLVSHQSGTDQINFKFGNTNLSDLDNHINCASISQTLRETQILSKSPPFASKTFGDNINVSFLTSPSDSFNGQDSVSNTEDSMNNIQLGERLKRTKSSVPNVLNNEQQDTNEEIEYEYVSVSKRVRSFEAISTSRAASKNPPCSPKIQRSPRIGRHCRHYTHPH